MPDALNWVHDWVHSWTHTAIHKFFISYVLLSKFWNREFILPLLHTVLLFSESTTVIWSIGFQSTTQETHQQCSSFLTSPSTIIPVDVALPKWYKRHTLLWQWIFPLNNKRQTKEDTSPWLIRNAHLYSLQQEGCWSVGCVWKNQRKWCHHEVLISGGKKEIQDWAGLIS